MPATLIKTPLPPGLGPVVDLAPMDADGRSLWLLLLPDGELRRFDADSGDLSDAGRFTPRAEPEGEPWNRQLPLQRLYVSPRGEFAAIVTDYGRYGQVIDLQSRTITMALDGGDYHPETVPFSFAFAEVKGRTVAIHRTEWNRLDVSDPATGTLLTERTAPPEQEGTRGHGLDYFHGALHLNAAGTRILDDGWVWHPVGWPRAWSLTDWLERNVWESEDGPSAVALCIRAYYWDTGMVWLDDTRVALSGLGDDADNIVDGARIFDVTEVNEAGEPREVRSFPGPAGGFFSEGGLLYSSSPDGLDVWDPVKGIRLEHLDGFAPAIHHRGARELVQLQDGVLLRWKMS